MIPGSLTGFGAETFTVMATGVGFAAWAAWSYRESGDALTLVMALAFAVAAAALTYYLRHLNRFLGR